MVIGAPAYATVILDVDSTVAGIEGIDWLAARRGDILSRRVASLTDRAMRGAIPLDGVYAERLAMIRPRRDEVKELSNAYLAAIAPGCADAVARMRGAGVKVILVSGGLRPALEPLAAHLGVDPRDLHAVAIRFDASGEYEGYDEDSPLATATGKRRVVESLTLTGPVLAVGDGSTDLAMRAAVDRFIGFTGFVRRDSVVREADALVSSFDELARLVLPQ